MDENRFINWMIQIRGLSSQTARSRNANCKRVEEFEGSLDQHFSRDGCCNLLARLQYSTDDERSKQPLRHKVPIDGNYRNGSSTLRSAVLLYVAYKRDHSDNPAGDIEIKTAASSISHRKRGSAGPGGGQWPTWERPTGEDLLALAKTLSKFCMFLNPNIVSAIAKDNEIHRNEWSQALEDRGVPSKIYLWDGSPCVFPGVRRYSGSREIASFRKHAQLEKIDNAVMLDDNTYPKHLWSFIFRGKKFQNFGPDGYALAHLIDHKADGRRLKTELKFGNDQDAIALHGLFTSAANTIYCSQELMKPTDHVFEIRNLVHRKAQDLYGNVCELLPPGIELVKAPSEEWDINRFHWPETVGTIDFMDAFLEIRKNIVNFYLGL